MTLPPKITAKSASASPAAQGLPNLSAELARFKAAGETALTPGLEKWITSIEHQAKNLVGTTFFAQMLKQMRDSPFKSDLFDGGRGGQAFAGLQDQRMVEHLSQRLGADIARPIVKKQVGPKAYAAYAKKKQEAAYVAHDRRA